MKGSVIEVPSSQVLTKSYGLGSKSNFKGQGTIPFFGVGEQLVENMQIDSGFYRKMKGNTLLNEIEDIGQVNYTFGFRKADGTYQTLEFYNDGTNNKMRAIEEDLTVITPSGGAGDVNFGSSQMGFVQIGLDGYITTKDTASNGNLWSWDGTTLTAVSGCPNYPEFLAREGQRLVVGAESIVSFSQRSTSTLTSFTGGTGISASGNYNLSGISPKGAVGVQSGIVIFFERGAELHKITPNNAGDDLSGETRVSDWNYNGRGIQNNEQVVGTDTYVYIINEDGLIELDPYTGRSENLIEGSGAMKKYFDRLNKDDLVIGFSPKERMVVFTAKQDGEAANDQLICYHLPYASKSDRPFYIKTGVSPKSLGIVNNKLYYGSQVDGKVYELFADNTFQDGDGTIPKCRMVREWDSLGSPKLEKRMQQVSVFLNIHPDSEAETNLFLDGAIDAADSFNTTQGDLGDNSGIIANYGLYILGLGREDTIENTDVVKTDFFNSSFGTYALSIEEQSDNDFRIYSVDVQYTVTPTSKGGKHFQSKAYINQTF